MQKKIVILIAAVFAIILYVGLQTEVYLGDECPHYRAAAYMYNSGERMTFDEAYKSTPEIGFNFTSAPLWHTGLAKAWKLFGGVSFTVAQLYHSLYMLLLMTSIYFLAKKIYGEKAGFMSVLILLSCPGFIVLSIVFYSEIPMIAFLVLSFLFLVSEYYILAGLFFGLTILTKISALLFIPSLVVAIILQSLSFKEKLKNLFKFSAIAIIINLPDMIFRVKNFHYLYFSTPNFMDSGKKTIDSIPVSYLPITIFNNPINILKYTGIILPILIILYFVQKKYQKVDRFIWLNVITYTILCGFMLRNNADVRYFMPMFPLLILLAAKVLAHFRNKAVVISLCILVSLHFFATLGYTYSQRIIPEGIKEGFGFISENLKRDAVIMYPEESMINYTGNPIAWGRVYKLPILFWQADSEGVPKILDEYYIDYIAVKKSRVYDDSKIHHIGGYPKSFVDRLPMFDFVKLLFENNEIAIWQIDKGS